MRSSHLLLPLVVALFPAVVCGGTETVRFDAYDDLSQIPGGWTHDGVELSSKKGDFKGGLRFFGAKHWLRSPRFGFAIGKVRVELSYSVGEGKTLTRFLTLRPIVDGAEASPILFSTPARTENYDWQTVDFAEIETDEFVVRVEGSSSDGNWYVGQIVVDYDEARPVEHAVVPSPEEPTLGLSARWKVSEFAKDADGRLAREADFSFAQSIKVKSRWENGVSVDSVYAYDNGLAVTNIFPSTYKSSPHGLYAVKTNEEDRTISALALQVSGDASMEMLLPIELDVERRVERLTATFRGWEPKVGTAESTTLGFWWTSADALSAIGKGEWIAADSGDFPGEREGPWRTVEIPGKTLRGAHFLCLRWCIPKQANSSLLGISDLRVTADLSQSGFTFTIR